MAQYQITANVLWTLTRFHSLNFRPPSIALLAIAPESKILNLTPSLTTSRDVNVCGALKIVIITFSVTGVKPVTSALVLIEENDEFLSWSPLRVVIGRFSSVYASNLMYAMLLVLYILVHL